MTRTGPTIVPQVSAMTHVRFQFLACVCLRYSTVFICHVHIRPRPLELANPWSFVNCGRRFESVAASLLLMQLASCTCSRPPWKLSSLPVKSLLLFVLSQRSPPPWPTRNLDPARGSNHPGPVGEHPVPGRVFNPQGPWYARDQVHPDPK